MNSPATLEVLTGMAVVPKDLLRGLGDLEQPAKGWVDRLLAIVVENAKGESRHPVRLVVTDPGSFRMVVSIKLEECAPLK